MDLLVPDQGPFLPSTFVPNEDERVQGALLVQNFWMFAWLVHAEPPGDSTGLARAGPRTSNPRAALEVC